MPGTKRGGTVFSFNGLSNIFAFFNQNYFAGQDGFTAYLIQSPYISDGQEIYSNDNEIEDDSGYQASKWSLTAASGVPDEGATLAMLGMGLSALLYFRRRSR